MGNETIQDTSFFNDKREKQGKNWKNRGKITKKQEKTGKNRKLQEIQKHHLDEVPENGNEFSARFREMLKTETETMSSRMSRNDDSRAKTMYRPNPRLTSPRFSEPCSGPAVGGLAVWRVVWAGSVEVRTEAWCCGGTSQG